MNIGELARTCNVPTQTIRFYERRGLLPEPQRQANGYRVYDETSADRIAFIRRAQGAGLTLAEIGSVLDVRAQGQTPCSHVSDLLTSKLREVDQRMRELRVLHVELTALIDRGNHLDPADCTDGDICHILGPTH
ncbi:MAG: heavy metal-responsive transcriptional regulator [Ilumatobacter sp.]|nr:heavy metal-responsive transcriptional regulator [Ilumatobacter sp.]